MSPDGINGNQGEREIGSTHGCSPEREKRGMNAPLSS